MEKDKKSNTIFLVIIGVLALILIAIVVIIVINKNNAAKKLDDSNEEQTDSSSEVDTILSNYNIKCEMPEEGENPKIKYFENIKTDGDRVLTSQNSVLLEYSTKEAYEEGKKNPEYKGGKFDDKNLTIEYILGTEVDYTESEADEEVTFSLDSYTEVLEELGYSCKVSN